MPDSHRIDLDAYLSRIGFNGARTPTAATLSEILRLHISAIPFENLDIHLGRGIRIDLPSIERKLVHDRRGGYCFEQNSLLRAALRELGFKATALAARVRWQVPTEVETGLTHMLLLVEAEGARWISDAGFGAGSLSAALRLDAEGPQRTAHEPRRLLRRGDLYMHQSRLPDTDWVDLYEFSLSPMLDVDCEIGNWWTCTHPQSRFTRNLTLARTDEGVRYTILNGEFTTRWMDGRTEKREIASPDELLAVLAKFFHLRFPAGTRFGKPGVPWPA